MKAPRACGVYVQVPFCQTKCTYCNFHTGPFSRSLYSPYVDAIGREIELVRRAESSAENFRHVDTVYVGGGTPSLLEPQALAQILNHLRLQFDGVWQEATLEADPETITREKAAAWRAAGFDRVSLGVQSFHDEELRAAGRMHRRADIFSAFAQLRAAGFANISADLIIGLPHQTEVSWGESLAELLQLRPEHISIYLLEVDEESRLGREVLSGGGRYGARAIPEEDAQARSYDLARGTLAAAGYEHYEISNWSLPGRESRHNRKYWRREPYLGLGAGAHSFDGAARWANAHDPAAYLAAIQQGRLPREQQETLTQQQALDEELFLGLRLLEGIDVASLEAQYNVSLAPRLAPLREAGLIHLHNGSARLVPERLAVSNEVFVQLLGATVDT